MNVVAAFAYNLALFAGTAWLVWHGWSAWWFLLAVGLCASMSGESE